MKTNYTSCTNIRHPPIVELPLPSCLVFDSSGGRYGKGQRIPGAPCLDIAFSPASSAEAVAIMKQVAVSQPHLTYGKEIRGFKTMATMKDYAANSSVGFGVVFHTDNTNVGDGSSSGSAAAREAERTGVGGEGTLPAFLPSRLYYEIWYNRTSVGNWNSRYGQDPLYARYNIALHAYQHPTISYLDIRVGYHILISQL